MIEQSHGKARPMLPRASDLQTPAAGDGEAGPKPAPNPTDGRGAAGRFAPGNRIGLGARWKATLKKAMGAATEGEAGIVATDASRVAAHVLRSLPSDAAPVRVLVGIHARHVALHAYFTAKAEAAGLDTDRGMQLLAHADRQSQRAERTLVTAIDVARVHAAKKPNDETPWLVQGGGS